MTKHQFVDALRGRDDRDKNRHLRRVIPEASTSDVLCGVLYILSVVLIFVSIVALILGVCLQHYELLWMMLSAPMGTVGIIISTVMIGDAKFEHVTLTIEELRQYSGKHVYIHWLNNVTGYEDGWYPFYGATEEFIRCNQLRPEVCVAPFEQYQRGWVAYAHKLTPEDFKPKG